MARSERLIARAGDLVERGRGVRFDVAREGRSVPAFAVRWNGRVFAYVNACAHRGVELDGEEGAFFDDDGRHLVCATHGALYEPADGRCVAGPCKGRSLAALTVLERDGDLLLVEGE